MSKISKKQILKEGKKALDLLRESGATNDDIVAIARASGDKELDGLIEGAVCVLEDGFTEEHAIVTLFTVLSRYPKDLSVSFLAMAIVSIAANVINDKKRRPYRNDQNGN